MRTIVTINLRSAHDAEPPPFDESKHKRAGNGQFSKTSRSSAGLSHAEIAAGPEITFETNEPKGHAESSRDVQQARSKAVRRYNAVFSKTPHEFRAAVLGGIPGVSPEQSPMMVTTPAHDTVSLDTTILSPERRPVGIMVRNFTRKSGGVDVEHATLDLQPRFQGQGVARDLLRQSMAEYRKMGVKRVSLRAAMEVGGYAWARAGFVPDERSWERLQRDLGPRLDDLASQLHPAIHADAAALVRSPDPKSIHGLSDLTHPVVFGKTRTTLGRELLLGSEWEGSLDLADKALMGRFDDYVRKRNG